MFYWGNTINIYFVVKDKSILSQNVVFPRTARCVKILGKGVVKVVHRCDAAKENQQLGQWRDYHSIISIFSIIGFTGVFHICYLNNVQRILYKLKTGRDWIL